MISSRVLDNPHSVIYHSYKLFIAPNHGLQIPALLQTFLAKFTIKAPLGGPSLNL